MIHTSKITAACLFIFIFLSAPLIASSIFSKLFQEKLKIKGRLLSDLLYTDSKDERDTDKEFRQAQLEFRPQINSNIQSRFQFDFSNEEIQEKDIYLKISGILFFGDFQIGHFREPIGRMELSLKSTSFMERSLTKVFSPGRNTGILSNHYFDKRRIYLDIGVFSETVSKDFKIDGKLDTLTTRIVWQPILEESKVTHLGISSSYRNPNESIIKYGVRPEGHLAEKTIKTSSLDREYQFLNQFEVSYQNNNFLIMSEYWMNHLKLKNNKEENLHAYHLQGSWIISGEKREYKSKRAGFHGVKPQKKIFSLPQKNALELVSRFSYADLSTSSNKKDKLKNTSIGLNWYYGLNTRIQFNLIFSSLKNKDSFILYQSRIQFTF